jgi:hypothetical protein
MFKVLKCRSVVEFQDMKHEHEIIHYGDKPDGHNAEWLKFLIDLLWTLQPALKGSSMLLTALESIGQLRYVLDALARVIYDTFLESQEDIAVTQELATLLKDVLWVCDQYKIPWGK